MELEELTQIWELLMTVLVNTKKQLSAIVKIWRLQKNWGRKVELEELTQIWELLMTVLVNTKKQLSAIVNIWRLQRNWETKLV